MNLPLPRAAAQPHLQIQMADQIVARQRTEEPIPVVLKNETAHLHRIRAALIGLERAVTEALTGGLPAKFVDQTTRPTLAKLRTLLHAPDRPNHAVDLDEYDPDPTGGNPDNFDRAAWAAEAVRTFGLRTHQIGPHNGPCVDGVEEMAADLICDLMHLLDVIGGDAERTIDRGRGYHLDEVEEEGLDQDGFLSELIGA